MIVTRSRRVEKALGKIAMSGRKNILRSIEEVVDLLESYDGRSQRVLRERFRDHALKGHMRGNRELHLGRDVLLIYRIHSPDIIELRDITSHEELRKRR